jgi:hypothetical protein
LNPDHSHIVKLKKASFDLEELGMLLPGTSQLMGLLSERFSACYGAGLKGNWRLAKYFLFKALKTIKQVSRISPQYESDFSDLMSASVQTVQNAIEKADLVEFEAAFSTLKQEVNKYHDKWGYSYIMWKPDKDIRRDLE